MKKYPNLSLRTREATSLARATAFNPEVMEEFFSKLRYMIDKFKIADEDIYNLDKTGLKTVPTPSKVVARKGERQVGQIVSAERGTLVTMIGAIRANGSCIAPYFVFPIKNWKPRFLIRAPIGSGGAVVQVDGVMKKFSSNISNFLLIK